MSDSKASYQQILKATSIFGGVQFFTILISIVRSKIISVLLGPSGLGIAMLLNSTVALINGITGFGLETSAVKSISEANTSEDKLNLNRQISVLRHLIWFTGLLGMVVLIVLSPWISVLIFNSEKYTFAIVWISIAVLFKQLSGSNIAVLQGLRKLNYLAKANLFGNLFGLILTVPLYYYWKEEAIAPSIVISTFIGFVFLWFYQKKIGVQPSKITTAEAFSEGKNLFRLGFMLSISGLITIFGGYLLQLFLNNESGVAEVGYYNAGFAILNSYVGMIFTAMSTDYYPRLASFSSDDVKIKEVVNQQALVGILLMTPIVVLFLMFTPLVVSLLYSSKFYSILPMLTWGILGMLFRTVSWSMGFILLVKGDSKLFIKTAFGFNVILLLISVFGYFLKGLEGLGIAFVMYYCIHFIGLKIITKRKYNFSFDNEFNKLFLYSLGLCIGAFLVTNISNVYVKYGLLGLIFIVSALLTFVELNKKVNFKLALDKIRRK